MLQEELPFRQVHLDFHTSQAIAGVGAKFDPDEFADTLARAHVNSINCFARCHHGWIYFDTRRHPQRRHPHLERNLLAEQIEACHARGIRVPAYTSVQWDHYTAREHPEWLQVKADGRIAGTPPYEAGFYRFLCLNTPYVAFLKEHVQEILQTLPTDGVWLDIVHALDCSCEFCKADMMDRGLDPSDEKVRWAFGREVLNRFRREMTAFIRGYRDDCLIFYNAGHVGPRIREGLDAYTHLELESLPSGGWGYLHFPVTMHYARRLPLQAIGMTGKFHTSWGDFHSFKNPAALEFECFRMLALNGKCCIGDQLHPAGKICRTTYDLIGSVYARVEKMEPYCRAAQPVTEIGVLTPEEFDAHAHIQLPEPTIGAVRMLQEGRHQFDILDSRSDFAPYKVLILPDSIPADRKLAAKIDAFVAGGGRLLASHRSGLGEDGKDFAIRALGVRLVGEAPFCPDFLVPSGKIGAGLSKTEHVMYSRGTHVTPRRGARVLAKTVVPYFNRTFAHFCSHRHTPSSGKSGYPGVVQNGRAVYFAHPVFTQYAANAPRWCKALVLNALEILLPQPLVRLQAPSTALAALNEQPAENRYLLHLLHYVPERRGKSFDVIEDVVPLHDLKASVRAPRKVQTVRSATTGRKLRFAVKAGRVEFTLPRLAGYDIIVIDFAV